MASAVSSSEKVDVTPEQIQTLLDDRDDMPFEDDFEEDSTDAPTNAVNAFADVEDW